MTKPRSQHSMNCNFIEYDSNYSTISQCLRDTPTINMIQSGRRMLRSHRKFFIEFIPVFAALVNINYRRYRLKYFFFPTRFMDRWFLYWYSAFKPFLIIDMSQNWIFQEIQAFDLYRMLYLLYRYTHRESS